MEERQSGGSDLPKPRPKRPESSHETLPPLRRAEPEREPERKSSRNHYGSDTAEFTVPPEYEAYPEDFDAPPRRQHPPQRRQPAASPKRRKHRSLFGGLVRWLLTLALVIFALYSAVSLVLISRLERVPEGERTNTSGALDESYVRSILLIGTDSRDLSLERGRSDSMILLTFNSRTQEISLNSFMRDAWVDIPGYGSNKLNAAYSYGGPELLMDTLEQNYDVSVDDYMCVSFVGFAGMIDAFGGVEITLSDEEAQAINSILQNEVNALMGDDALSDFLPEGGTYILNGKQALSYARIRYVGNADFERTSRQREVMTQLITNAKARAAAAVPELMQSALPHITTNMTATELYLLSLYAPFVLGYELQQQQIPADGTWSFASIDGQSVLQVDFPANTKLLRDTAYADSMPAEEAQ